MINIVILQSKGLVVCAVLRFVSQIRVATNQEWI